ncbi:hypothetical protein [Actinocrispum wychmicini]|uniref:Uncharacterized protein n=1 Tax=Actinocrispum wychmicini TaxID=1213861 RepID=A0A4R2JFI3_9PSEU|nr:hypothetical protein [Actinocrispum wychmicini]TCO55039.1 hypothetical protein EV192_108327 [Actinocrispum wychmicini]
MHVNWSGLGEVFVIALVAGVGLVTLFSLAVVSYGRRAEGGTTALAVAGVCLLACAAIVGYGIYLVVAK